jgi:hypothetical protein
MSGLSRTSLLLAFLPFAGALPADAQQDAIQVVDSTMIQLIRLSDGSSVVGRISATMGDSVVVRTATSEMRLSTSSIRKVETAPVSRLKNGEFWPENPNATRLIFAPSGRQLAAGDGYFSSYQLLFLGVSAGVSNRVSLGGGMSIIPATEDFFSNNVYYLTPKVGVVQGERTNIAVGALIGQLGNNLRQDSGGNFGILYGVGTLGSKDNSATVGLGYGYANGKLADYPVIMAGGETRITRRMSLLTENYLFSAGNDNEHLISYGVRFFGEKISVDLALLNNFEEFIFPGFPFIGFVVAF